MIMTHETNTFREMKKTRAFIHNRIIALSELLKKHPPGEGSQELRNVMDASIYMLKRIEILIREDLLDQARQPENEEKHGGN